MNQALSAHITFSYYRILSKPGAGGMGEVYLAQGTRLEAYPDELGCYKG